MLKTKHLVYCQPHVAPISCCNMEGTLQICIDIATTIAATLHQVTSCPFCWPCGGGLTCFCNFIIHLIAKKIIFRDILLLQQNWIAIM